MMRRNKPNTTANNLTELVLEVYRSDGYWALNKNLVRRVGLVRAAVLSMYINKYIYWSRKNEQFDGWFYLKNDEVVSQLGLTKYTVKLEKKELKRAGLLLVQLRGAPAREWFSFDFKKLARYMGDDRLVGSYTDRLVDKDTDRHYIGINKTNKKKTKGGTRTRTRDEVVLPFNKRAFHTKWNEWKDYKRQEFNFKYKSPQSERGALTQLQNLAGNDMQQAIAIIDQSMGNGWKGFFELKNGHHEDDPSKSPDDIIRAAVNGKEGTVLLDLFKRVIQLDGTSQPSAMAGAMVQSYNWILHNQTVKAVSQPGVPAGVYLLRDYVTWLNENSSWITGLAPGTFKSGSKLFSMYLRQAKEDYGVNVLTGSKYD